MRLAIVSDVHGNLEALDAVLADLEGQRIDESVCLGDFVGYGASPNECIERLRPRIVCAVAGNHDLAACGRLQLRYVNSDAASAARWTDAALTAENRAYLEALPYVERRAGALLVHSSPASPEDWNYVLSPYDAEYELSAFEEAVCFIGHSHYPGSYEAEEGRVRYTREPEISMRDGCRYLVNVGSVGQPRDGDPNAAYLVYDVAARTLVHRRVPYDVAAAGARIRQAGLPPFLADRLQWGE